MGQMGSEKRVLAARGAGPALLPARPWADDQDTPRLLGGRG